MSKTALEIATELSGDEHDQQIATLQAQLVEAHALIEQQGDTAIENGSLMEQLAAASIVDPAGDRVTQEMYDRLQTQLDGAIQHRAEMVNQLAAAKQSRMRLVRANRVMHHCVDEHQRYDLEWQKLQGERDAANALAAENYRLMVHRMEQRDDEQKRADDAEDKLDAAHAQNAQMRTVLQKAYRFIDSAVGGEDVFDEIANVLTHPAAVTDEARAAVDARRYQYVRMETFKLIFGEGDQLPHGWTPEQLDAEIDRRLKAKDTTSHTGN